MSVKIPHLTNPFTHNILIVYNRHKFFKAVENANNNMALLA